MCGRRVEGWRGLMPGSVDGEDEGGEQASPREVAGQEEQTRRVRPSKNLAAVTASAAEDDIESRKPTGEVPSLGHELRARAPDKRVHTSPIGNVLPSDFLHTLDAATARERSGSLPRPREASSHSDSSGRSESSGRSGRAGSAPRGPRRAARLQGSTYPALSAPPPAAAPDDEPAIDPDPNTPAPVASESTHYIPRRRRQAPQAMQVLRTIMWGILWLGLGGAVAFSVVLLLRRGQPQPPPPAVSTGPGTPPRRPAPPPGKVQAGTSGPRAPTVTAPVPARPAGTTRAHDLVVPIPAGTSRPPLGPAAAVPALGPTSSPLPTATPPPAPELPLDPQQQAAAEQTMSNLEFVVSEKVAQVRACYDRAVRSAGPDAPAGRVEVSLTLTEEGQATAITTVENTVGSPQLAGCLEQRIAEWRFPRPFGIVRTFRLPFTFSPSPSQSGPRPRH